MNVRDVRRSTIFLMRLVRKIPFLKSILKTICLKISPETLELVSAYSIYGRKFSDIRKTNVFEGRYDLWSELLNVFDSEVDPICYVEFGVYKGASIKWFAFQFKSPDAQFIGLDSFEGLPEDWVKLSEVSIEPKGQWSTKGQMPVILDNRVHFIKGLFQDTIDTLLNKIFEIDTDYMIVHYDADLYSSTLFALCQIDRLKRPYYAIFDEFLGHETRALYDYLQSYSAKVEFMGRTTGEDGFPLQNLCRITPHIVS